MNQIEVRNAEKGDMPISKNTAYKWHSLKKNPQLVYKVGGILMFDKDEWVKMSEKAKADNVRNATSLSELGLTGGRTNA